MTGSRTIRGGCPMRPIPARQLALTLLLTVTGTALAACGGTTGDEDTSNGGSDGGGGEAPSSTASSPPLSRSRGTAPSTPPSGRPWRTATSSTSTSTTSAPPTRWSARCATSQTSEEPDAIMGDAFAAEEAVAQGGGGVPRHPFAFGSGENPGPDPNMSVFDNSLQDPAYLAGMLGGGLTKCNVIGVVGAMPIPEVNRIVNALRPGREGDQPEGHGEGLVHQHLLRPRRRQAGRQRAHRGRRRRALRRAGRRHRRGRGGTSR